MYLCYLDCTKHGVVDIEYCVKTESAILYGLMSIKSRNVLNYAVI